MKNIYCIYNYGHTAIDRITPDKIHDSLNRGVNNTKNSQAKESKSIQKM